MNSKHSCGLLDTLESRTREFSSAFDDVHESFEFWESVSKDDLQKR